MSDTIDTVTITSADTALGYVIIDASDFDADTMTLFDPAVVPPASKKKAPQPSAD